MVGIAGGFRIADDVDLAAQGLCDERTGGEDDGIGRQVADELLVNFAVETHIYTALLAHVDVVLEACGDLVLAGRDGGKTELAAEFAAGFAESDLMAALGCGHCGDESAGAAADDKNLLGLLGSDRGEVILKLMTGDGVYKAACLEAACGIGERADAGLGAADAGDLLVETILGQLVGQLGVCERGTAEADEVGTACLKAVGRNEKIVEASNGHDGDVDGIFDDRGRELVPAGGHHRGSAHILDTRVGADGDVKRVNAAILGDARTIEGSGAKVIQLHTGGMCHLDADMTRQGLAGLGADDIDLAILENVGNLVCPAEFDTGAVKNAMILSVPEGHDKPLKYPLMFTICDAVIINKIDVMPYFDFDLEKCRSYILRRNPNAKIFPISARTGEGVDALAAWLLEETEKWRNGENE